LTGISKGGFGGALGGIGVPLMAIAVSPAQAAGIMLPILCLMDWTNFRYYWKKWDTTNLKMMLPGALIGVALGTLTFGMLDERTLRFVVGLIAILFTLNYWFGVAAKQPPSGPSLAKGTLWSVASGFTSFIAHAGGPPLMMYLLPQRLDKVMYVGTISLFFTVINLVKVVPYAWLGQFSAENLIASAVLAPLVPFGVWLGVYLQGRLNQTWFYRVAQTGLFLTGLQLIYQSSVG
jgi:uncharacterized protein